MTDSDVRAEQVRTLYRQSGTILGANVLNAVIVTAALWSREAPSVLLGWMALMMVMAAGRVELGRRYRRARSPTREDPRWGTFFAAGSTAAGALWGAAAFALFDAGGPLAQILLTFVIGGMSAAAAGTVSCYLPAFFGFVVPALVPLAFRLVVMGDSIHQSMGLMIVVYGLGLSGVAFVTHRSLRESFRLRFEKDRLLRELADSRNHLTEMNRTLEARVAERTAALERQTEALRASQRLEAVGRLAGGIAHDFNNLLAVIFGSVGILAKGANLSGDVREGLVEIRDAAERGANLVRQLLLFSRRQRSEPRTVDLNQVVGDMQRLLHGIVGDDLEMKLSAIPPAVLADPTQIEQVIVNLVTNARDATETGGRVTIETDVTEVPESNGRFPSGSYAVLSVRDTGIGMDDETRSHAFEPFFTTKDIGKGTGLGLATVYGIVEESGGHILVDSEPNAGTCFRVFLPTAASGSPEG